VYEAARVDGASRWRTWASVTLPLLRPALLVATVLNVIYVFNSFPWKQVCQPLLLYSFLRIQVRRYRCPCTGQKK
jgi:ABC-type spermidine/putrescine transport system permease subunit II